MTSPGDALILAALDQPDDVATRCVLSDWLEENGTLRSADRPEWLRLNGWWRIRYDIGGLMLYWAVFPGHVWFCVGKLPRPVWCYCCGKPAVMHWPIHAQRVKRWLCMVCYDAHVILGTIHTEDNKRRWR